ncbi:MAG: DUF4111 domain-containing protein [Clostridia bacterium]|nr:DUF4111 domain-containing protein [Clostridia bacterium]
MNFKTIHTLSEPYIQQIKKLETIIKEELGEHLAGIYLHGSLCLECFVEGISDVDVLVVSDERLPSAKRLELARRLLTIQHQPSPLELSVIYTGHLKPWHHPTPTQFHISDYHQKTYEELTVDNNLNHWLLTDEFGDPDIACHATLIRQSGICLTGRPIDEIFPEIPEEDFWQSITNDLDDYDFNAYGQDYFTSNILILGRIWSYKAEKRILSKYEAGRWAVDRVPERTRYVMENALNSRFGIEDQQAYDKDDLEALRVFLIEKIRA